MSREQLTTVLALLVAGVWAVTVISAIVLGDYAVLTAITPVMLIVTGFLFGVSGKKSNGNSKKDDTTWRLP